MKGKKTGGRVKGTPNKLTTSFKEAVQTVYHEIGGNENFARWARRNETEYYKIAARLIPTEITGSPVMKPLVIDVVTHADLRAKADE
jgi:hypothetical protein